MTFDPDDHSIEHFQIDSNIHAETGRIAWVASCSCSTPDVPVEFVGESPELIANVWGDHILRLITAQFVGELTGIGDSLKTMRAGMAEAADLLTPNPSPSTGAEVTEGRSFT